MRATRDALDERAARMAARSFCEQVQRAPWARQVSRVAAYEALGRELCVRPLLAWWMQQGVEVALPRVVGKGRMVFVACHEPLDAALHPGKWGLREPLGEPVALESIDLILVPGTAFDRHGGRLGMGGGFYDRALAMRRVSTPRAIYLGVGYHFQLLEGWLPMATYDQRVDLVCTPEELVWCG